MSYTVTLPAAGLLGRPLVPSERVFAHHDTFASYLNVWHLAGYLISWPTSHHAVIA